MTLSSDNDPVFELVEDDRTEAERRADSEDDADQADGGE